jgi:hypothetical protein
MDALLIFPPFFHPRTPHLALPTLAGYLTARGFRVAALDANLEFFRYFLTEKNIDMGRRYIEDLVLDYNRRNDLTLEEKGEYLTYVTLLQSAEGLALNEESIFGDGPDSDPLDKEDRFRFGAALAGAPYRPEGLVLEGGLPAVQYRSPWSNFSTHDLSACAGSDGLASGFFRQILPEVLARTQPRLVGISVAVEDQVQPAFQLATAVKELAPEVMVVMGGSFVSSAMRRIRRPDIFRIVDGIVLDDGERPLEKLLEQLTLPSPDLSLVPGLTYFDGQTVRQNEPTAPLPLEELPPPDFSILDFSRYLAPAEYMSLPFRSSRGCYWAKCAYCRTEAPVVRHYSQTSADFIFENLRRISDLTGVRAFAFTDEASAPKVMDRLSERILREGLNVQWGTCFRLDRSMTLRRCRTYHQAGCININYGLEVYNDRLLKLINKGTTVDNINFALGNTAAAGIFAWTYMMVGLPTETRKDALAGYEAVRWLQRRGFIGGFNYSVFQLYRDSKFWRERDQYGFHLLDPPPGQDLDGPIDNFEVPGMERKTAYRLASDFNTGSAAEIEFNPNIPVKGCQVPANHDLGEIFSARSA